MGSYPRGDSKGRVSFNLMPNISLTDQEKEILKLGQEFKRLQDSPAYQKTLEWLYEYVNVSQSEMLQVADTVGTSMEQVAKATLVWRDRTLLLELLERRVNGIVEQAKTLAESIAQEAKDAEV
jgi:adenosyl cobinamide kinase/adenosyl cobinamide phosphate guanylyltransferase